MRRKRRRNLEVPGLLELLDDLLEAAEKVVRPAHLDHEVAVERAVDSLVEHRVLDGLCVSIFLYIIIDILVLIL